MNLFIETRSNLILLYNYLYNLLSTPNYIIIVVFKSPSNFPQDWCRTYSVVKSAKSRICIQPIGDFAGPGQKLLSWLQSFCSAFYFGMQVCVIKLSQKLPSYVTQELPSYVTQELTFRRLSVYLAL